MFRRFILQNNDDKIKNIFLFRKCNKYVSSFIIKKRKKWKTVQKKIN